MSSFQKLLVNEESFKCHIYSANEPILQSKNPSHKIWSMVYDKKINAFCQEEGLSLVLIKKWPLIAKQKHFVISLQSQTHPARREKKKSHNLLSINILKY